MTRALLLPAILATSWVAWSQQCDQAATAIILDEKTHTFVPAITPEMLQIKLGQTSVPVTRVEPIAGSRVLILIDDSGSMGEEGQTAHNYQVKALFQIKKMLRELLSNLPPGVQVQYGIFHNKAAFAGRFSSDPKELSNSLTEVAARLGHPRNRDTALFDAIHEALAQFVSPQPGDSILVFTDGGDDSSTIPPERVQREAEEKGVRLFAIRVKEIMYSSSEQVGLISFLKLVEQTGGSVHDIDPDSPRWNFNDSVMEESKDLRTFWTDEVLAGYVLRFSVPLGLKKNQQWTLSLSKTANPKGKTLVYSHYLRPCALTTELAH